MQNEPQNSISPEKSNQLNEEQTSRTEEPKELEQRPSRWGECYTLLHDLVYILAFITIYLCLPCGWFPCPVRLCTRPWCIQIMWRC